MLIPFNLQSRQAQVVDHIIELGKSDNRTMHLLSRKGLYAEDEGKK
jgi:hypothetical protein